MTQGLSLKQKTPFINCRFVRVLTDIFVLKYFLIISCFLFGRTISTSSPSCHPLNPVVHDQRLCFSFILAVNFGVIFSGDFKLEYFRSFCHHTIEQFSSLHLFIWVKLKLFRAPIHLFIFAPQLWILVFTLFRKDVCAKRRYEFWFTKIQWPTSFRENRHSRLWRPVWKAYWSKSSWAQCGIRYFATEHACQSARRSIQVCAQYIVLLKLSVHFWSIPFSAVELSSFLVVLDRFLRLMPCHTTRRFFKLVSQY